MRELAYLNKGITISLTDRRIKEEDGSFKKEIFHSDEGVKEFVRFLNRNNEALINDVIYLNTEKKQYPPLNVPSCTIQAIVKACIRM